MAYFSSASMRLHSSSRKRKSNWARRSVKSTRKHRLVDCENSGNNGMNRMMKLTIPGRMEGMRSETDNTGKNKGNGIQGNENTTAK